jgi:hypothetical protein
LKENYEAFDGGADLYVYFYEQGLRLLRPGGRMGYVVTNKWLKAHYAENLRGLFADNGWLEFVADFGHAKHFFPDADVFPSVVVVRKPDRDVSAPQDADICVIPRDAVPTQGLAGAVARATFPLPRAMFTRESRVLEPKPVMDLLQKIRRRGVPFADYAGVKPFRGILTGLNEAFLIDSPTRDRLVRGDPACDEVIRPYLRGQDIDRWWSPETGLFMIVLKSSGNHAWPWSEAPDEERAEQIFLKSFPTLHGHMKAFEEYTDPETKKKIGLRVREDKGRFWWELRSCDYYHIFSLPRIVYQAIKFYPRYSFESGLRFGNNKMFAFQTDDMFIGACLNSPLGWYYSWRHFLHLKDEALSNDQVKINTFPLARPSAKQVEESSKAVSEAILRRQIIAAQGETIVDWLRHEFGIENPGTALTQSQELDADSFAAEVRKELPKSHKLSAADIARLKHEHATTVEPARRAAHEALALERRLSDLVNAAYGLTPEDIALMWATAPPRIAVRPDIASAARRGIRTEWTELR